MNDDPELVDMKRKANTRSLKEMATLLRLITTIDLENKNVILLNVA